MGLCCSGGRDPASASIEAAESTSVRQFNALARKLKECDPEGTGVLDRQKLKPVLAQVLQAWLPPGDELLDDLDDSVDTILSEFDPADSGQVYLEELMACIARRTRNAVGMGKTFRAVLGIPDLKAREVKHTYLTLQQQAFLEQQTLWNLRSEDNAKIVDAAGLGELQSSALLIISVGTSSMQAYDAKGLAAAFALDTEEVNSAAVEEFAKVLRLQGATYEKVLLINAIGYSLKASDPCAVDLAQVALQSSAADISKILYAMLTSLFPGSSLYVYNRARDPVTDKYAHRQLINNMGDSLRAGLLRAEDDPGRSFDAIVEWKGSSYKICIGGVRVATEVMNADKILCKNGVLDRTRSKTLLREIEWNVLNLAPSVQRIFVAQTGKARELYLQNLFWPGDEVDHQRSKRSMIEGQKGEGLSEQQVDQWRETISQMFVKLRYVDDARSPSEARLEAVFQQLQASSDDMTHEEALGLAFSKLCWRCNLRSEMGCVPKAARLEHVFVTPEEEAAMESETLFRLQKADNERVLQEVGFPGGLGDRCLLIMSVGSSSTQVYDATGWATAFPAGVKVVNAQAIERFGQTLQSRASTSTYERVLVINAIGYTLLESDPAFLDLSQLAERLGQDSIASHLFIVLRKVLPKATACCKVYNRVKDTGTKKSKYPQIANDFSDALAQCGRNQTPKEEGPQREASGADLLLQRVPGDGKFDAIVDWGGGSYKIYLGGMRVSTEILDANSLLCPGGVLHSELIPEALGDIEKHVLTVVPTAQRILVAQTGKARELALRQGATDV